MTCLGGLLSWNKLGYELGREFGELVKPGTLGRRSRVLRAWAARAKLRRRDRVGSLDARLFANQSVLQISHIDPSFVVLRSAHGLVRNSSVTVPYVRVRFYDQ